VIFQATVGIVYFAVGSIIASQVYTLTLMVKVASTSLHSYTFKKTVLFTKMIYVSEQCSWLYIIKWNNIKFCVYNITAGERSRYSDWLGAGRPRGRSSSPGGGKNFHVSMSSRTALGSTQPPIQGYRGLFPRR
jgi:hypothetical protein